MTRLETHSDRSGSLMPMMLTLTVFLSAMLVFMVEPMTAKIMLPLLGGGPSVWNTSLAFFQAMLLLGYGYAHLLQRVSNLRLQAGVHSILLLLAAFVLPLRAIQPFGPPNFDQPSLWLLGTLTASIGAPFAILSATAPLIQAWHVRTIQTQGGPEPYGLYAASNVGSLLALLVYPAIVEPLSALSGQTLGWSFAYAAFALLMGAIAFRISKQDRLEFQPSDLSTDHAGPTWLDRGRWLFLAAVPSSLMLGVTTYITTDVASAPFLWIIPLALYLVTFIIAFANRSIVHTSLVLMLQAAAITTCVAIPPFSGSNLVVALPVHLGCFFLTALVCHQALVARRPTPDHLTEFYLWMSFGGVVGGSFNALVAPLVFNGVWEYPLVLALSCLALPWGKGRFAISSLITLLLGTASALLALYLATHAFDPRFESVGIGVVSGPDAMRLLVKLFLVGGMVAAFLIRGRAFLFFALICVISFTGARSGDRIDVRIQSRSFFGVVKESRMNVPGLGGEVKMMAHGTTLHGAQAQDPRYRCRPLLYYAPETPIGQVFTSVRKAKSSMRVGAVGLGSGAVSAYVRPSDKLTFFEIDPLVVRISSDPKHFSYTTECARGPIDYVVGDARLTLARQPVGVFDILLIDAFSSDSVPAHLLTVEAMKDYLTHLKTDGILVLHLSNRNLELKGPAMAVAYAAGGHALVQEHVIAEGAPQLWESSEDAVIVAKTLGALSSFSGDPRWHVANPNLAKPWTDDYTNIVGSMLVRMKEPRR